MGRDEQNRRIITESHRAENKSQERRHERYLLDEKKHIEVIKATRGLSVDIVGFYHSHPDHPSRPSIHDLETDAWPGYSYLIVSVYGKRIEGVQSWILPEDSDLFEEESISSEDITD